GSLIVDVADTLAGTVHVSRPRVSRIHLKAPIKAAIQAQLHSVIGRVPLTGANQPRSKIRMEILPVELTWIRIGPGCQPVTLRSDIPGIEQHFPSKFPLKSKRPPLRLR